jgi:vitamin B12 transporter
VQSSTHDEQYFLRGTAHLSSFAGRFDETLGVTYSNLQSTDLTPVYGSSLFFGNRWKVDWQGNLKLSDTETLVLGAEDQRDAISQPLAASINIASGYAELQSTLFKDFNDTISVRYDANDHFGGATTFRIAPTYYIEATGTKLEASVGTGFKAPSLSQLFESFPAFGFFANPNLRPEESTGYDAGFEQYLWDQRVQFGATYFYNKITNLITDNDSFTTDINIGKAHTDGVESFLQVLPTDTLKLRLDYTYTDAIDDVAHDELIRRPRNKWSFDAQWQATHKLSLDANLVSLGAWIDGNRDFSISRLTAPGYTTVNISANYDLTRQLAVYGRITNLFDEHYEDPFGFLRPSRGFYAGVKARF